VAYPLEKAGYYQIISGFRPQEQVLIYSMVLKEAKLTLAT
jgi:hypothetical protein